MKYVDFYLQAKRKPFAVDSHTKESLLNPNCPDTLKLINAGKTIALRTKVDYSLLNP